MTVIRVARPTDPELARLWDEAKRGVEERADDCSMCRCAPATGGWSDDDTEREKWLQVWSGDE